VRAIVATDQKAGPEGLTLTDLPYPAADNNEVVVQVCAASMTPGELTWPSTWTDRAGNARTVSVPGHEVSGVVAELGYGTTGLSLNGIEPRPAGLRADGLVPQRLTRRVRGG